MEKIIIAGHGSPKKDANNIELIAGLLHNMIHPSCGGDCVKVAYLQFENPDIMEAISSCVDDGAVRIIVHPYFLSSGMHVTTDIPGIIREAEKRYPDVEFIYTEPLGIHTNMAKVVLERIESAAGRKPDEIEKKSFEIISDELDFTDVPEERRPIVKRVVHTTADFELGGSLVFHPEAVQKGIEVIKEGRDIITDVEMVRTGINRGLLEKRGGSVMCGIQGPGAGGHDADNKTRAEKGIEEAFRTSTNIGIIAIGNAPTALLKTIDILNNTDEGRRIMNDVVVVGVPVGFVKAVESKALLVKQDFPFITNVGRKGGSTVAVAIVNALLKMAESA